MRRLSGLLVFLLLPACNGLIGDIGDGDGEYEPPPSIDPQNPLRPPTPADPSVAEAPLARLTGVELRNTLAELFGPASITDVTFDSAVSGATRTEVSASDAIAQFNTAEAIAATVYQSNSVMSCSPADSDRATCTEQIVRDLGLRVFRRPINDEEVTRYTTAAATAPDFDAGVRLVVSTMLASPKFSLPNRAGARRFHWICVTSHGLRDRLSALLRAMAVDARCGALCCGRIWRTVDRRGSTSRGSAPAAGSQVAPGDRPVSHVVAAAA